MKTLLRLLPLVALLCAAVHAASNDSILAAVRAADVQRVTATKNGDRAGLTAILSDELRYAHSSGKIDTKASYIQSLASHATVYESFDYADQQFKVVAPGVVLMSGRALINAKSENGTNALDLNFLAVWREENGRWRFLAWQSCKNPAPADARK